MPLQPPLSPYPPVPLSRRDELEQGDKLSRIEGVGRGMDAGEEPHKYLSGEKRGVCVVCVQTIVTQEMGYFVHELKMSESSIPIKI